MAKLQSIRTRFLVSVVCNVLRAGVGFVTGLLVARGLKPAGYGDFTFLLGSFAALRSLLDMGSSSAFYTFISRRRRCRGYYLAYCGWLALQFLVTALLITLLMPEALLTRVWLGHGREVILLAFAASFMQQQVWQTLSQIGEAVRKSVQVQVIAVTLALGHLALVYAFMAAGRLSVPLLFVVLSVEYLLAILCSFLCLPVRDGGGEGAAGELSLREMLREFGRYCRPLMLLSWIGFLYEFADRWLLQRFGGADQQGFYQIAFQFSAVSLLATSSILNVFWKEIAEAKERGEEARIAVLYRRVNRGLVMCGAVLSGLLIPWTGELVTVFLGPGYALAVPALLIMFLYPIHQSMGQIGGTMLLAGGNTREYTLVSAAFMLLSLPLSYLSQAPAQGALPGLALGATGMALKMVLLNIASVNVQAWIVARRHNWRWDWLHQVGAVCSVLVLGFAAKALVQRLWGVAPRPDRLTLALPFGCASLIYLFSVFALLCLLPGLAGVTREELSALWNRLPFRQSRNRPSAA